MRRMYHPIGLRDAVTVTALYSFHYFQFASGYIFSGEAHDFWEMVYIDKGEADIGAGEKTYRLGQGQVMFHQPNEWHSIWANSAQGPNIFVISFSAEGVAMERFRGRHFTLKLEQRALLSKLIAEGSALFGPVLDISELQCLQSSENAQIGSEQMLRLYLESLLIQLLREKSEEPALRPVPAAITEEGRALELTEQLTALLRQRLDGTWTFAELCRRLGVGETTLKRCAKRHLGTGVMEYYQRIRVEEARRMLREGRYNVSQIAEALGYSSLQAFSRQFRHIMGVTPTQYTRMVIGGIR